MDTEVPEVLVRGRCSVDDVEETLFRNPLNKREKKVHHGFPTESSDRNSCVDSATACRSREHSASNSTRESDTSATGASGLETYSRNPLTTSRGASSLQDLPSDLELPRSSSSLDFARFVSDDDSFPAKHSGDFLSDEKIVGTILDLMISSVEDPVAQLDGLRSLRNISYDETRRALIGISGGIRVAVDAMKSFPTAREVQDMGILFLTDVCQSLMPNKLQLGQCGGIKVIVDSLGTAQQWNSKCMEQTCVALWTCCQDCQLNQTFAREAGALETIFRIMRQGPHPASLQNKCLRTTLALITNNPQNAELTLESGGVLEVLAALQQFACDTEAQIAGMQVLCELLRQNEGVRENIGDAGLIEKIEVAMATCVKRKPYIISCCGCIRYLAFHDASRADMASRGFVALLSDTLRNSNDDETVVISILMALCNLTYDNAFSKHEAACDGRVRTLVELLTMHRGRRVITEQTCRLLRNIADGGVSTKRVCIRGGAVAAVAEVMKAQPAAPGVQEHGAAMMLNLSGEHGAAIGTMGLDEHIEKVLKLHATAPAAERQMVHLQNVLKTLRRRNVSLATILLGVAPLPVRTHPVYSQQKPCTSTNSRRGVTRRHTTTSRVSRETDDALRDEAMASAVAALGKNDTAMEY